MSVSGSRNQPAGGIWAAAIRQACRLTLLTVLLGVVLWAVRADRLPLVADPEVYALDLPVPLISLAEARKAWDEGAHHFIDTRAGDAQGRASIAGAFVVRETSFAEDLAVIMDFVYPEDALILFGEAGPMPVSAVAVRFLERGYRDVRILQGGLRAWRQAGGAEDVEDDQPWQDAAHD